MDKPDFAATTESCKSAGVTMAIGKRRGCYLRPAQHSEIGPDTNAVGYAPQKSTASSMPARRPYIRAPTAKMPQAAASEASHEISRPAPATPRYGDRTDRPPLQRGQEWKEGQIGVESTVREPDLVAVSVFGDPLVPGRVPAALL